MTTREVPDVQAAGAVVFRPGRRVLLVHRPKYDDWSFPKGKLDRGEHVLAAAVREVAEETGLHVRLGVPLSAQRYPIGGPGVGPAGPRTKTVRYWVGRVVDDDDVAGYVPNAEIDEVAWVEADKAEGLLTYPYDRATLAEAVPRRRQTQAIVVLRHAKARSRSAWRGDDTERPLLRLGAQQAERLVPLLAAFGVTRVVSSSSLRCRQTVEPFVRTTGWELETRRRLSEEAATPDAVHRVVADVVGDESGRPPCVVVCTHRPVLPDALDALDLEAVELEPAEMLVAHVRKARVVGIERHRAD